MSELCALCQDCEVLSGQLYCETCFKDIMRNSVANPEKLADMYRHPDLKICTKCGDPYTGFHHKCWDFSKVSLFNIPMKPIFPIRCGFSHN